MDIPKKKKGMSPSGAPLGASVPVSADHLMTSNDSSKLPLELVGETPPIREASLQSDSHDGMHGPASIVPVPSRSEALNLSPLGFDVAVSQPPQKNDTLEQTGRFSTTPLTVTPQSNVDNTVHGPVQISAGGYLDEFTLLQFTQAAETYRTEYKLLVQAVLALGTADIAILGWGVNKDSGGICLLSLFFPYLIYLVNKEITRDMLSSLYTAISIEQTFDDRVSAANTNLGNGINSSAPVGREISLDRLVSTFVASRVSTHYIDELKDISTQDNFLIRIKRLQKIQAPHLRNRTWLEVWYWVVVATVLQLGVSSWYFLQQYKQPDPKLYHRWLFMGWRTYGGILLSATLIQIGRVIRFKYKTWRGAS